MGVLNGSERRLRALARWRLRTRWVKRILPRSLFARTLIIIVAPVLLIQATLAYVFVERHWETVTRRLCRGVAGDVAYLAEYVNLAPGAENSTLIDQARRHLQFEVAVLPGEPLPVSTRADYPLLDRVLRQELAAHVGLPFTLDTERYPGFIDMHFQLGGAVMRVLAPLSRVSSHTTTLFFLWMVGASLLFVGVAIIFLRNQVRPIRRLATAAAAFGKGQPIGEFKPTGADEVRQAASEFLAMRERIERHVRQRTEMLAGISHDLRTPLTRMRLELAMLPDSLEVQDLAADVREMEQMVEEFLAFARGADGEAPSPVDLHALLVEVAAEARAREDARPLDLDCAPGLVLSTRRRALKRALVNLVNNAFRHAQRVRIGATQARHAITILVDDDGPGIPADKREAAFRPFVRLDEARNLDQGGVGLGLAITRDLVRAQGGDVELDTSPMGGLRVRLRLPM